MTRKARILEVTSYPPPRAGWGIRVEFLKKRLEREGHSCVVLNTGSSRQIPSTEYETVMGGQDFVRKVWRFARKGYLVHTHANGDSMKGAVLALVASGIACLTGRRPVLTFHAGAIQRYFPRSNAPHLTPLFWLLFLLPRRIICNSEAVRERIQGYGVSAKKIVPIPAFSREYLEYTPARLPDTLEEFLGRFARRVFTYLRMRPLFYPLTLVNGMAMLARSHPDVGLVICGGLSHSEGDLWREVQEAIAAHNLADRICFVDDLDHDAFLTALQRCDLYVRTPITDGVASSVLEALALGVPVVACDNGTRPAGVLTYPATDGTALARAVAHVLDHRTEVLEGLAQVEVPDTLTTEVKLLTTLT
jgi:glycosyltransferase involved in cell wall biosynthesis